MTVEESIEYWEGLRKTFSSQLEKEENHFGRMHLQTTIDVLDTTISALRAQQQTNAPLTLDELRKMEGEPVYIVYGEWKDWRIPDFIDIGAYKGFIRFTDKSAEPIEEYGKNWLAYRRKPEEEADNA